MDRSSIVVSISFFLFFVFFRTTAKLLHYTWIVVKESFEIHLEIWKEENSFIKN